MKTVLKPIEMVLWMDEEGSVKPVRFRLSDENGAKIVVKILHVNRCDKERIAGIITWSFHCQICLNDQIRESVIRYRQDECKWFLFKI